MEAARTNKVGDIIDIGGTFSSYCRIVAFTQKRICVRPLRFTQVDVDHVNQGEHHWKYQLDFGEYPSDKVKYIKVEYYKPYVGDGLVFDRFFD